MKKTTRPTGLRSHSEEIYFLEGPHTRKGELGFTLRVLAEFVRGFRALHFIGPSVTVFGSARFKEDHPYYRAARSVGEGLVRLGLTVITGGGPGIMEAANRGAFEAGGRSIGCNIRLPMEEGGNSYTTRSVTFRYFFVRKVLLLKYSFAFVIMPGGFGTMDECFETLTLIQTGKIENFPVVLMGVDYWSKLRGFLDAMVEAGTISAGDLDLLCFTDSVEEALAHVQKHALGRFGLSCPISPIRILGESSGPFPTGR